MFRRRALTAIQILVSLGCLAWLWMKPEIHGQLLDAVWSADPQWIGLGIALAGLVIALGVVRWQLFLRLLDIRISWWENIRLSLIGAFFNLILIGTVGGDAVKALYLARRHPDKRSEAVVSLLMDHLCGLPVVVILFAAFCLTRWEWLAASGLSSRLALFAGIYLAGSLIGVILLFLLALRREARGAPRRLPLWRQIDRFSRALLLFIRHWRVTLAGSLVSLGIHLLYFGTFHAAARAMGAKIPLMDLFTILPVVDVITTLPVSISGIGIRETLFESFLLRLCDIPSEIGVSISLLGFGFGVFWSLLGGALFPFDRPASPQGDPESLREVIHEARLPQPEETAQGDRPSTEAFAPTRDRPQGPA